MGPVEVLWDGDGLPLRKDMGPVEVIMGWRWGNPQGVPQSHLGGPKFQYGVPPGRDQVPPAGVGTPGLGMGFTPGRDGVPTRQGWG